MAKRLLATLLFATFPLFAAEQPTAPADVLTPPADAVKAENGLVTKQLTAGTGTVKPTDNDVVKVRYTVWRADGKLIQDVPAGKSLVLPVTKMVPGWAQAVKTMVAGETLRAWIPVELNAGKLDQGLIFDTDLIEVIEKPKTPEDVAAPPADAKTTESGLAYKVLRAGTGTDHPRRSSTVTVHYSGWTTDGRMFDSSVMRGTPSTFPLDGVIKGWTEGVQLMVPGEKTRFWIPARLAYPNDRTKPQGMLVFDIELVGIK